MQPAVLFNKELTGYWQKISDEMKKTKWRVRCTLYPFTFNINMKSNSKIIFIPLITVIEATPGTPGVLNMIV
jgi:hypothetical protein